MSAPSHFLSPAETEAMDEQAKPFVAAILAECRAAYPDFDGWPENSQTAAFLCTAVQVLVRPSVQAIRQVNLDAAAFGIALALGHAFAAAGCTDRGSFVAAMTRGIETGVRETERAVQAMPTIGSQQ